MRPSVPAPILLLLVLVGAPWSALACSPARRARGSTDLTRSCYAAVGGQPVYSTLVSMKTGASERLIGLTELGTGARLVEEATIGESGRLLEAEATLTAAAGPKGPGPVTRMVLHPGRSSVEVTGPVLHVEWSVPNDLPWVWAPLLTSGAPPTRSAGSIATPLSAWVAFRSAETSRAVRLLDLGVLQHHTVTADQLVIPDGAGATVVLADDVIDVEDGVPRRLRLAALDSILEVLDARAPSSTLVAALRCTALSGSSAP